jgi:hypothetical protein
MCKGLPILAVSQDLIGLWVTMVVVLLVFGTILVGVPIIVIRRLRGERAGPERAGWEKLLQQARTRVGDLPQAEPLVTFKFHTYSGFLIHFTQSEHRHRLPHRLALEYLWELHRYNLVHSLIPYKGSIFVPLLSWTNYRKERRSIIAQAEGFA